MRQNASACSYASRKRTNSAFEPPPSGWASSRLEAKSRGPARLPLRTGVSARSTPAQGSGRSSQSIGRSKESAYRVTGSRLARKRGKSKAQASRLPDKPASERRMPGIVAIVVQQLAESIPDRGTRHRAGLREESDHRIERLGMSGGVAPEQKTSRTHEPGRRAVERQLGRAAIRPGGGFATPESDDGDFKKGFNSSSESGRISTGEREERSSSNPNLRRTRSVIARTCSASGCSARGIPTSLRSRPRSSEAV